MNTNQQIVRQWEEQEALHRFQLISPLLREDLDNAKKLHLRKKSPRKMRSRFVLYTAMKSIQRRTVFRIKTGNQEETPLTETARKL